MSVTTAADELANMETREASPAHFLIKIESFSLLEKCGIDKYETREFSAGEYKWKLIIYPNGDDDKAKDCNDYISVHVAVANTSSLPANWEVNAVFSIFLFNQISANYLSSLGRTRRFLGMKSEWGISKFISKKIMLDPSNGYLVNDTCVFGAEVFVINSETITECLHLKNVDIPYKRDWKIPNFSQLGDVWESEEFSTEDHKWKMCLYAKGNGEATRRGVSVYLEHVGTKSVKACFTIRIENQISDKHSWKKTDIEISVLAVSQ
ncbi:PREDICTED: ubiquitin carboxyl-terminal hydrolase 12-like [Erythranthe guttata]|uniref:ubiquitin carboxyl-terminal hydrolase 12-like n=1 Tax=Erythranthe guttata TaxID=4155 RepID=UPI00064E0AAA|nr:PREDICTED: ubiquitin carboxyl-terminal hydrolase 12-like [Erythranthe guttata]|eukprot:XP_012833022.1 PREDICTED: ubiquitin carboxyl-terminal hydrolase 12-like [Erythranthe guttata]